MVKSATAYAIIVPGAIGKSRLQSAHGAHDGQP